MRFSTRLLVLPLFVGLPAPAVVGAQIQPAPAGARSADTLPISVRWNRLVPRFVDEAAASRRAARAAAAGDSAALRRLAQSPPLMLFQVYPLLSVAQYTAANAARDDRSISSEAAIAGASAAVLSGLFTDSTVRASIARELARDVARARSGSGAAEQAIAGQRLGEELARGVIARAPTINIVAPWNGTIPTGPGTWYSARGIPPIGAAMATARGWVLDSASRFRPEPPPAYGSPAFDAALEEVRRVGRERTAEQLEIAQRWNAADPWALWNETASAALGRHRLSDVDAARVLAVMNVASSDAMIACFEAKYHYWTIRPSQADTTFALPARISLPNFPSYPSGHACSAGTFDAVLGHFIPQERAEFTRIAEEQAMSRLYGGIHYRFDNDVGLALGRAVGRYVVEQERRGALNSWRTAKAAQRP